MAPPRKSQMLKNIQDKINKVRRTLNARKAKPPSRASAQRAPNLGTHILLLFVGPNLELITLHSSLLPEITQAYLRARAAISPFHQLPSEDPAIVRLYRDYLYTKKIHSITATPSSEVLNNGITNEVEWSTLAQSYLFSLRIKDEKFSNSLIDAFIEKVECDPREQHYPTGLASEVWSATEAEDPLRKLIVDLHIWVGKGTGIDEDGEHEDRFGPRDFKYAVAVGVLKNRPKIEDRCTKAPWEGDACAKYHVHKSTVKCGRGGDAGAARDGVEDMEFVDLTED